MTKTYVLATEDRDTLFFLSYGTESGIPLASRAAGFSEKFWHALHSTDSGIISFPLYNTTPMTSSIKILVHDFFHCPQSYTSIKNFRYLLLSKRASRAEESFEGGTAFNKRWVLQLERLGLWRLVLELLRPWRTRGCADGTPLSEMLNNMWRAMLDLCHRQRSSLLPLLLWFLPH